MFSRRLAPWLVVIGALSAAYGCALRQRYVHPELARVGDDASALAISDALESLIADGRDTSTDREYAYRMVRRHEEDTAAYAFARAAVTGRLVQQRGLVGADLVPDIERFARRSREIDPDFRDGAATRLLGTLYVVAPGALLAHGDSEQGLDLLERLTAARPEVLENHLRLAEAYVALGDPAPAVPHLCRCLADQGRLRHDDQQLLARLFASAGAPGCVAAAPAPAP